MTMDTSDYTEYRPLMFSIAYRMTGSVSDAEDIVQEAFLRAAKAKDTRADSPKSYLAAITTRLAIDHLRSARVRRESYVGTWLPEPLLGEDPPGPAELAETSDSLSMAFLVLLESLSPAERAVLLLREVFGYEYKEIADITAKNEPACRQIFARARRRINEGRPRFDTSRPEGEELAGLFLDAVRGGDMAPLLERLAPDVAYYGDSGGWGAAAFASPIYGRDRVAALLGATIPRVMQLGVSWSPTPTAASSSSPSSTCSTARYRPSGRSPIRRSSATSARSLAPFTRTGVRTTTAKRVTPGRATAL